MSESLFQVSVLLDFVKLLIWTGQLADERPASAIIVAPAGSGKTTLLENVQCDNAAFVGDLTARPLSGLVRNSEKITHILLGDMLSIFGHKAATVKLTTRLISQMTGESLLHDPWTGDAIPPRKIGLITAIPPEDFKKQSSHIQSGGFASRFLIIRYCYKPSTIAAIHRFIAQNRYADISVKPFIMADPGKWQIKISDKLASDIKDFGQQLRDDPIGFRAHRHLRAMVKAEARRNARPIATEKDFLLVQSYCEFFSKEGKEI
ncbi:MAG: hypothetical protein ACREA9_28980 [Pyrinomonadaceae bacterium]